MKIYERSISTTELEFQIAAFWILLLLMMFVFMVIAVCCVLIMCEVLFKTCDYIDNKLTEDIINSNISNRSQYSILSTFSLTDIDEIENEEIEV